MDKIQVTFTESEYTVYHDYCLRYFQARDAVKRQSLHAFLDLFEKGIIPVGETDIQQARRFLLGKCDAIRRGQVGAGGREGTKPALEQACSDLLLVIDDLEKMFRLIKKQGVPANYLMILAAFAKIIEENRDSPVVGNAHLDRALVEDLAAPLAMIIRANMGTDRNWHSVLHELTAIAARWNKLYPEPKFELDILQQVAPAVVSYFDEAVKPREVLSLLPSYFEEDELEEFEAFLDQKPDFFDDEQDAGVRNAISEPLGAAARAVAAQRDQGSRIREITDHSVLFSPPATRSPEPPAGAVSLPGPAPAAGSRTFEISVGPAVPPPAASSPDLASPPPGKGAVKTGLRRFIPAMIGIVAIVLLVTGFLVISGNWPVMGAGNTTSATTVKTTTTVKPTTVKPAATTVKPAATTAKPAATTVKPATTTVKPATTTAKPAATTATTQIFSSTDIGNHLVDIAFGTNNYLVEKPTKSLVGIAFAGMYSDDDLSRAYSFVNLFNNYSSTTKLSTNIDLNSGSDITIQFMPASSLEQITPERILFAAKDTKTGTYYFVQTMQTDNLDTLTTYVNADLQGNTRKRWSLRAIMYNLGFEGETGKYTDSLFYSGSTSATQLSTIDMKAMQLMYGQKVHDGMTKSQLKAVV